MLTLVLVTREQDGTLYWSTIVYVHTLCYALWRSLYPAF